MPHRGLGTLRPSELPGGASIPWVERGAIADNAVRRVWVRNFESHQITAAGLTTTTVAQGGAGGIGSAGIPAAAVRFTRSSDGLVMIVDANDIVAVSAS
jgi:hypothetical protein